MSKKAVEDRARYSLGCSPSTITPSAQPQLPPGKQRTHRLVRCRTAPTPQHRNHISQSLSQQSLCRARTSEQRSGRHRQLRQNFGHGAQQGRARSGGAAARQDPCPELSRAVPRLSPSSAELPPPGPVRSGPAAARGSRGGRGAPLPPALP